METFTVTEQIAEALENFFSKESFRNIGKDGFFTIGVCDDEGFVAGVLQFYVDFSQESECYALVDYMYIQDEFKDTEAAQFLVDEYDDILSASGVNDRFLYVPADDKNGEKDLYRSLGFDFDENVFFVYEAVTGDFEGNAVLEKVRIDGIGSLSELDDASFAKIQKSAGCKRIVKKKDYYDQALSSFFKTDKGCGLFLIRKRENGLLATAFLGCSSHSVESGILSLIAYSAGKAKELYGPDMPVRIGCINDSSRKLVMQLFPGLSPVGYLKGSIDTSS